ncbi:MAG: hypothetical protein ACYC2P_09985 [Paludibacteraceae bacterium]
MELVHQILPPVGSSHWVNIRINYVDRWFMLVSFVNNCQIESFYNTFITIDVCKTWGFHIYQKLELKYVKQNLLNQD